MSKKSRQRFLSRTRKTDNDRNNGKRFQRINAQDVTDLTSLRAFLSIKNDQWDAIIVGDGSGSTWDKEMGYSSVLIRNDTFERMAFWGGANRGTSNVAEIMAIFQPLLYLSNSNAGLADRGCRVHVVTDSTYVVNGIQSSDPVHDRQLRANRELWLALHAVKRKGIRLFPHHIHRDTIDLNRLSHDLANLARKSQIGLIGQTKWKVDEANP